MLDLVFGQIRHQQAFKALAPVNFILSGVEEIRTLLLRVD